MEEEARGFREIAQYFFSVSKRYAWLVKSKVSCLYYKDCILKRSNTQVRTLRYVFILFVCIILLAYYLHIAGLVFIMFISHVFIVFYPRKIESEVKLTLFICNMNFVTVFTKKTIPLPFLEVSICIFLI